MYSSWSEIAVRIIEKFVMIHLGPIKTFLAKVQILCSKSLLIAYFEGMVLRIGFTKSFKNDDKKE